MDFFSFILCNARSDLSYINVVVYININGMDSNMKNEDELRALFFQKNVYSYPKEQYCLEIM